MATIYEWATEEVDEHEDIIEVNHFATLKEAKAFCDKVNMRIVLVRDVYDKDDDCDLIDRQHAYIQHDGMLPPAFDGGAKVPQKFHAEVKKGTP